MRKIFLTLGMILCLVLGAEAQRTTAFGVKAGVNFATIDGPDAAESNLRFGYHVGGMVDVPIALGVSLQPELLLSLKGTGEAGSASDNLSLLYIEMPVMAKVMLGPVINLQFGVYGGYLVNAERDEADLKDLYQSFDGGVGLGLGYTNALGLTFDARYMYGLSQVNDNPVIGDINAGNRVIQLSLGFLLGGNR